MPSSSRREPASRSIKEGAGEGSKPHNGVVAVPPEACGCTAGTAPGLCQTRRPDRVSRRGSVPLLVEGFEPQPGLRRLLGVAPQRPPHHPPDTPNACERNLDADTGAES